MILFKKFIGFIVFILVTTIVLECLTIFFENHITLHRNYTETTFGYSATIIALTIGTISGRFTFYKLLKLKIDAEEFILGKWILIGTTISTIITAPIQLHLLKKSKPHFYEIILWSMIIILFYFFQRLYKINLSRSRGFSLWLISYDDNSYNFCLHKKLIVESKSQISAYEIVKNNEDISPENPKLVNFKIENISNKIYFKYLTINPQSEPGILANML